MPRGMVFRFRKIAELFHRDPYIEPFLYEDQEDDKEQFRAYGTTAKGRYITVPFTIRKDRIRAITARPMTYRNSKIMPTQSTKTPANASARPKLKDSEDAYVESLHSPAGQKAEAAARRKRAQRPVITVETPLTPSEMRDVMRKTGANVRMAKGFTEKPNDPVVLEAIIARAAEKQTRPISIRIPVADLNAVKRLAGQSGIRYQTILKDLIHEGLHSRLPSLGQIPGRSK